MSNTSKATQNEMTNKQIIQDLHKKLMGVGKFYNNKNNSNGNGAEIQFEEFTKDGIKYVKLHFLCTSKLD